MKYLDFTAPELAQDPYFRKWVKEPDDQSISFWETWLAQHPDKEKIIIEAREMVTAIRFRTYTPVPGKQEQIKENIDLAFRQHLDRSPQEAQTRHLPIPEQTWHFSWRTMAAGFAGILLLVAASLFFLRPSQTMVYSTAFGETERVTLPDGSTVVLNANSRVSFDRDWQGKQVREVEMEGEAYFSVVHTSDHQKFIVRTSNQVQVEVLGTEFSVADRKREARVVLNSGKVRLTKGGGQPAEPVVMQPGEMVEIKESSEQFIKKQVDPQVYSAWKDNKLIFDQTPLADIASLLEENYGYTVNFSDPALRERRFKGTFPADDVSVLLEALSVYFHVSLNQPKRQLQFEGNAE